MLRRRELGHGQGNPIYLSIAGLLKIGSWDVEKRSRILPLAGGSGYIVSLR